jgi:hypothetical protein
MTIVRSDSENDVFVFPLRRKFVSFFSLFRFHIQFVIQSSLRTVLVKITRISVLLKKLMEHHLSILRLCKTRL